MIEVGLTATRGRGARRRVSRRASASLRDGPLTVSDGARNESDAAGFTRLYAGGEAIELRSPDTSRAPDFADVLCSSFEPPRRAARCARKSSVDSFFRDMLHGRSRHGGDSDRRSRARARYRFFVSPSDSSCSTTARFNAVPEPPSVQFNNPYGACRTFQGFRQHHRTRS